MNNTVIIIALTTAIVVLAMAGAAASLYVAVHPTAAKDVQPLMIIGVVLGFLTPTITSFAGMIKGFQNQTAIQEIKAQTNGLTTHLVAEAAKTATLIERAAGDKTAASVAAATVIALDAAKKETPPVS